MAYPERPRKQGRGRGLESSVKEGYVLKAYFWQYEIDDMEATTTSDKAHAEQVASLTPEQAKAQINGLAFFKDLKHEMRLETDEEKERLAQLEAKVDEALKLRANEGK